MSAEAAIGPIERRWIEGLGRAEREIALLERVQPRNAAPERARLRESWLAGRPIAPEFRYAPAPELRPVFELLDAIMHGSVDSLIGELCAERAVELELEARLVEAIGTPAFARFSQSRFAAAAEDVAQADAWADSWLGLAPATPRASRHLSDDAADPRSLVGVLQRRIGGARLPIRVEVRDDLSTTAATGEGVICVRRGIWLYAREAERIALHELEAHALPRIAAAARGGIATVGTAGASDDEEGRAIWLEQRAGYLDDRRKAELGRRHAAARAVRAGASFVETVQLLLDKATSLDAALDLGCRVFRGGGLAREVVYLTALSKVERAFAQSPELEAVLAGGRFGVDAARRMRATPR